MKHVWRMGQPVVNLNNMRRFERRGGGHEWKSKCYFWTCPDLSSRFQARYGRVCPLLYARRIAQYHVSEAAARGIFTSQPPRKRQRTRKP